MPEGTVYQPRQNNHIKPKKNKFNILRIIGTTFKNVWKRFKKLVRRLFGA